MTGVQTCALPILTSSPFSLATLVGNRHYPPQSAQNQASAQGVSHFIDGSGPIFAMYMEMAEEEDKKLAESWKADAEGILVFVRHYPLVLCFKLTHWS